jgi:hypothetical protein
MPTRGRSAGGLWSAGTQTAGAARLVPGAAGRTGRLGCHVYQRDRAWSTESGSEYARPVGESAKRHVASAAAPASAKGCSPRSSIEMADNSVGDVITRESAVRAESSRTPRRSDGLHGPDQAGVRCSTLQPLGVIATELFPRSLEAQVKRGSLRASCSPKIESA